MANYESTSGSYPMGFWFQLYPPDSLWGFSYGDATSPMVALLNDYEQGSVFNALNQSLGMYCNAQATVIATGISTLWCPSDGSIQGYNYTYPPGTLLNGPTKMYYSSYATNFGVWATGIPYISTNLPGRIRQANGITSFVGYPSAYPSPAGPPDGHSAGIGVPICRNASITDGTSNTIAVGERAHGLFGPDDINCWNWWVSGNYGDTQFTEFYPINPQRKLKDVLGIGNGADDFVLGASSFHPGGAISPSVMARSGSSRRRSIPGSSS